MSSRMQPSPKITRGLRKDVLVESLEKLIDNFNVERKSQNGSQSVETSLTNKLQTGFNDHLLWPPDWIAGVRRVYYNSGSNLSFADQELLFNVFATFTSNDEVLRKLLRSVIRADEEDTPEATEAVDGKGESFEDGDSSFSFVTAKPWHNWQEWVGRKILEAAPRLITPKSTSDMTQSLEVSQSILSLAVVNDADWVIPTDLTTLSAGERDKVKQLLKMGNPETLLEYAVKLGYLKTAKKLIQLIGWNEITKQRQGSLLNIAITTRKEYSMEITRSLVNAYPYIIDQLPNDQSALQILRGSGYVAERDKSLEDFLVSKIVRRESVALVRRLLSDRTAKELYVNLSFFNDERHNFDNFLSSLVESKFNIDFYSTLMYVELPRLKENTEIEDREEAFVVLNWLRKRLVHTVLELHVPDALHTPHRDEDIKIKLGLAPGAERDGFREIKTLNWEKLDLSLETLKAVNGLRKVYLYSANWNTLAFWTGPEGLSAREYKNITEIIIHVVKNNISSNQAELYKMKALARLKKRKEEMKGSEEQAQKSRDFDFEVKTHTWKSGDPQRGPAISIGKGPMTPREVTELQPFLKQDPRPEPRPGFWPYLVRVAIIDNGIDASIPKIWNRVAASQSFVEMEKEEGTREASWWVPSDPHGTQMASIIVDIDPRCQLYIAKVGTGRESEVNRGCVLDALKWATTVEKVDIVVMCFAYTEEDKDIATLMKDAHNEGEKTLFFCSTGDMGKVSKRVYPASLPCAFAISSCTRAGKEGETTDPSADYYFQGEEVHADCLSYWTCGAEAASGSSVATAIAAGVASLILSCRFLADGTNRSKTTRKQTVEAAFEAMKEKKEDKYVAPGRLFKEEEELDVPLPWTTSRWNTWVHNLFGPGKQYG